MNFEVIAWDEGQGSITQAQKTQHIFTESGRIELSKEEYEEVIQEVKRND